MANPTLAENKVVSPIMRHDADADGVVDDFASDGNRAGEATYSVDERAQRISMTDVSGSGFARINQVISGLSAGEEWKLSAEMKTANLSGSALGALSIEWLDSGDSLLSSSSQGVSNTDWQRRSLTVTAPASTAKARIVFLLTFTAVNEDGDVWIRKASFTKTADTLSFQPGQLQATRLPEQSRQRSLVSSEGTLRIIEVSEVDERMINVIVAQLPKADEGSFSGYDSLRTFLLTTLNWRERVGTYVDTDGDTFLVRYWDEQFDLDETEKKNIWDGRLLLREEA